MRLWHFTSTLHLPMILRDGHLRTTESNLSPVKPHVGLPVVWFMDTPELTHDHGLGGSAVDKTAVRVEVDVRPAWVSEWLPWAEAQGINRWWLDALLSAAGGREAAERWHVTFRRIPRHMWVKIDNAHTGEVYWKRES